MCAPPTPEGEPQPLQPPLASPSGDVAVALAWHPRQRLLAVGWADGGVSLWSPKDQGARFDRSSHDASVTTLAWSPDGVRLVSGDAAGKVCVWKADPRGRPVAIVSYTAADAAAKLKALEGDAGGASFGRVSHVVFNTSEELAPSREAREKALLPIMSAPFHYVLQPDRPEGRSLVSTADDQGNLSAAFSVEGKVTRCLYYAERGGLALVTKEAALHVYRLHNGALRPKLTSKLAMSAESTELFVCWAGPHMLASAGNGDSLVRMLDLQDEDNFQLPLLESDGRASSDKVSCLAFEATSGTLGAGTRGGRMAVWLNTRYRERLAAIERGEGFKDEEEHWRRSDMVSVGALSHTRVEQLHWAPGGRGRGALLAAAGAAHCTVLRRAQLQRRCRDDVQLVQLDAGRVHVSNAEDAGGARVAPPAFIKSELQVSGVDASGNLVLVWSGRQAQVWERAGRECAQLAAFSCDTTAMAIADQSVFRAAGGTVQICNLQGVVRQSLAFEEAHGSVEHVDVCGEFLAAVTRGGFLKMWRVGGREARPHGPAAGRMVEVGGASCSVVSCVRVNADGSRVAVLANAPGGGGVTLLVYDVESDLWFGYDCAQNEPVAVAWDAAEPRLLAIELLAVTAEGGEGGGLVHTLFVAPGTGVHLQEEIHLTSELSGLVGVRVPHVLLARRLTGAVDELPLARVTLRDFSGMEGVDEATSAALLDFSYNLALGNMDEAFKSVRLIRNVGVWENMAKMCVKTKRLDVVEHCLSNMGHVRGARAARLASKEPETEARMGLVAIQLGMLDDAERLFNEAGRFDLLNDMYQAQGKWGKAIEMAESRDRIHLCNTHFKYGRHLESIGNVSGAIKAYEQSKTHRAEVPRMLHELSRASELEEYVKGSSDAQLVRWWARYCEAAGDHAKAMACYEEAGDTLSVVRMHCAAGDFEAAEALVRASGGDAAASFHLARQYEARVAEQGEGTPQAANLGKQALRAYAAAGRPALALRLAMRFGLDSEVMTLAMQAPPEQVGEAAAYFDARQMYDKSVLIHQRCGNLSKALDLCFRGQLFDSLRLIVENLSASGAALGADAELLARCADFFLQHAQFDKAMSLFVASGRHAQALELCLQHNIALTEELADKLTPPKTDDMSAADKAARQEALLQVAQICAEQGAHHLASKKYVQAGDKLMAMKVLLRSGDTEKICFFAGVSRQRDIYILAGNYLQSLDWHADPAIMKNIISFYLKAKAMDSLSGFYESCAQVEIDEYRDYSKALGALQEAVKYCQRSRSQDKEERLARVTHKQKLIEAYVQALQSPADAIGIAESILEHLPAHVPDHEQPLRAGDVYNLMLEAYVSRGNTAAAQQTLERMRQRVGAVEPYVDRAVLESILGADAINTSFGAQGDTMSDGMSGKDFVEEAVEGDY